MGGRDIEAQRPVNWSLLIFDYMRHFNLKVNAIKFKMFNKYSHSSHRTLHTYIHAVLAELSHFLPWPHLLPVGNGKHVFERL